MSRFSTLLQREWMQHHRGWLVLMLAPPVVALIALLLPFSSVEVGPLQPAELMSMASIVVTLIVLGLAAISVLIQAPGLARRDRQDRSIEFWLSLPPSHAASIGATLLMHLLLVPLLALALGAACSQIIGLALVGKVFGVNAWLGLPWGLLLAAAMAGLLRLGLGVLLASLWLMPLVLLMMAASAWLKRWGVPMVTIVLALGHGLLGRLYGVSVIGDSVNGLIGNAARALIHGAPMRMQRGRGADAMRDWLAYAPGWMAHDALVSVADLAQPLFLLGLAVSAGCFALLVFRRGRNG